MKPVGRISVTEATVESIKEQILSGGYTVGDKLPSEMELSSELNVSRNTIREAIKVLQALGFIEQRPGKGAFVAKTNENDTDSVVDWFVKNEDKVSDFMSMRISVETTVIKQAIKVATDDEIKELVKKMTFIQDKFEEAESGNDIVKMGYYDKEFHNEIAKATKDKLLIAMETLINEAFTGYRLKKFSIKENARNAFIPHRNIIEAIRNRDIEKGIQESIFNLNSYLDEIKVLQRDR